MSIFLLLTLLIIFFFISTKLFLSSYIKNPVKYIHLQIRYFSVKVIISSSLVFLFCYYNELTFLPVKQLFELKVIRQQQQIISNIDIILEDEVEYVYVMMMFKSHCIEVTFYAWYIVYILSKVMICNKTINYKRLYIHASSKPHFG